MKCRYLGLFYRLLLAARDVFEDLSPDGMRGK